MLFQAVYEVREKLSSAQLSSAQLSSAQLSSASASVNCMQGNLAILLEATALLQVPGTVFSSCLDKALREAELCIVSRWFRLCASPLHGICTQQD